MEASFFDSFDPLVWWHLALVAVAFAVAAFIIGLFGVAGGVIFVPALLMLPGMEAPTAVSTTFLATWPMSMCRMAQLQYYKRVRWREAAPVMAGGGLAAFPGQLAVRHIPKVVVLIIVAVAAIYAGTSTIVKYVRAKRQPGGAGGAAASGATRENSVPADTVGAADPAKLDGVGADPATAESACREEPDPDPGGGGATVAAAAPAKPSAPRLLSPSAVKHFCIGVVGGFVSSLGGLGGPVVLMPLFLVLMPGIDMKSLIALTSPGAFAIVTFATVGGVVFGRPDCGLASGLGVLLIAFTLLGGYLQERVDSATLKLVVAGILVALGCGLLVRAAVD